MSKLPTNQQHRQSIDELIVALRDTSPAVQSGEIEIFRRGRNIVVRNVKKTNK